jgi:hypothetical protein
LASFPPVAQTLVATTAVAGALNIATMVGANAVISVAARELSSGASPALSAFVAIALYDAARGVGVVAVQWGYWALGMASTCHLLALMLCLLLVWMMHQLGKWAGGRHGKGGRGDTESAAANAMGGSTTPWTIYTNRRSISLFLLG